MRGCPSAHDVRGSGRPPAPAYNVFVLDVVKKKKKPEEKEKRLTIGAKDICNTFVTDHQE
jgi:hypothetical protein